MLSFNIADMCVMLDVVSRRRGGGTLKLDVANIKF
jgi:hypothetical protein